MRKPRRVIGIVGSIGGGITGTRGGPDTACMIGPCPALGSPSTRSAEISLAGHLRPLGGVSRAVAGAIGLVTTLLSRLSSESSGSVETRLVFEWTFRVRVRGAIGLGRDS